MDTNEPHKCKFTLQIDAAIEQNVFEAPGFRFRFLDGSRKTTSAIGAGGWTASSPVTQSDGDPLLSSRFPRMQSTVYRFEQVFTDIVISESFATALDEDPILSFFFFDHPGQVATTGGSNAQASTKDPKGGKIVAPASESVQSISINHSPKAYAGLFEIDVSSLLSANCLSVEQTWMSSDDTDSNDDDLSSVSAFAKPTTPKRKLPTPNRSLFELQSSPGLQYLSIRITIDQPLLNEPLLRKLNPLTITVGTIKRLPGVVSTARNGTSAPHAPLIQYCRPVFALLHFFPDKLQSSSTTNNDQRLAPRIIMTPGKTQDETIEWNHSVTFLISRFNYADVVDALNYGYLTIEIHDRDLKQQDKLAKLQNKWESLCITGNNSTSNPSAVVSPRNQDMHSTGGSGGSRTTTPRTRAAGASKPMDVFVVDEIAKRDWHTLLLRSGECFPYGLATFRLTEVLNTAKQLVGFDALNMQPVKPYMRFKLTADVSARKRREKPLGTPGSNDEADSSTVLDLSPIERLVREPGAYITSNTTLSIIVTLQQRLHDTVSSSPALTADTEAIAHYESVPSPVFSRMVVIIPYSDNTTLAQISKVMEKVNLTALLGVPIRSYQMSEQEKAACNSGELDVITGIQIIDSHFRMIVLEGLADKGMRIAHEQIPRHGPNDPQGYRMYANNQLRFTRRLYTAFEIDLKRIKLRHPLHLLMHSPDIYMRSKVSEHCYLALSKLGDMRSMTRLEEIKSLDLFPTAEMLVDVESKYGESITLEDIHGQQASSLSISGKNHQRSNEPPSMVSPLKTVIDSASEAESQLPSSKRHHKTYKPPTDATNASYDQFRKTRTTKDFILERKKQSDQVRAEYTEMKEAAAAQAKDQPQIPVYMYSGQKLRTQDILQDEMRQRLMKDRSATYTYSREFQSLAVSLVNTDALQQIEAQEERKKWTTQRGFVYPAPRPPAEYYRHPDKPSAARCEDLHQPFVDNVNHPKPVSRDAKSCDNSRPEFSTLPSKNMIFGGTNADGTVNSDYFRSVHLCGEGLRLEMEEALQREQQEWDRKLVVDRKQLKFLAHGNICSLPRAKPSQLDKVTDILAGPPHSKPLRIVKNATLPSGKRVVLEAPPVTIHNQQEYVGPVAATFATTLRPTDSSQFLAADALTGQPKTISFPSNTDILTPPVKKHITRKVIVPVQASEKHGLLWENK